MKKVLFLCVALASAGSTIWAQNNSDFLQFFPNREGAQLVNKTYDENNDLQSTTTMTVQKYYDYQDGSDVQIDFVMVDADGNQIDQGNIEAYYQDGSFYLKMSNSMAMLPDVTKYLSLENELVADFLDYPNPMGTNDLQNWEPVFAMDGGDFTIYSKANKKDFVRIHDYNRQYVGDEDIQTPAGNFHAYKVTYDADITCEGKTTTYQGVEWFAPGAGIVRSEIYKDKNLQNYTVLSSLVK